MKVIKATQQMLETRTLVLGFQGENLRTQLRIDCAATFAEYPNATPALAIKPPSGATYPVFVERDGNEVVWDIVANNLILKGDGELQLTFYKDNVIAKTSIGHITVNRSLQIDGEMPDVVATWIENANRKLAEVDAQIVELEGMVDTATDAATRAQQSESNATTAAANAATSAATASTKAAEAQASANTATAKASEAALSATQASNSAMSAADSESGATAKAAEAAQSAQTAAQKAEQITEAAQIATGKAEEASASATAAQASATNAASSATAAQAAQTAAKASETAAGASATQAAQSVQNASTAAQTAEQKAGEAATSATNAAASATNAATSAETASTKAGEAAQSAQAVEETAEQLAESLEQIDQNTADIAEHEQYTEATYAKKTDLSNLTSDLDLVQTSGNIIEINDAFPAYAEDVTVEIVPVQSGSGDPSPENVRPITGFDSVKVSRTGKNLSSVNELSDQGPQWGGDQSPIKAMINTLPVGTYTLSNKYEILEMPSSGKVEHGPIYVTAMINGKQQPVNRYTTVLDNSPYLGKVYEEQAVITITEENKGKINHTYTYCDQNPSHTGSGRGKYRVFDIQLELSDTATPYEPYHGIQIELPFGQTVYGGQIDLTTGKLTVDRASVELETLNWTWNASNGWIAPYPGIMPMANNNVAMNAICSTMPVVSKSISNSIVAQGTNEDTIAATWQGTYLYGSNANAKPAGTLCYRLATPQVYNLNPAQVLLLRDYNVLWANTGDIINFEYRAGSFVTKKTYDALKEATLIHNTASGSIASFVDGAEMPVDEVTVQINPVQDLHGYDNPWPAGGGVNLFDIDNITYVSGAYGLTTSIDGDVVRISGTYTGSGSSSYRIIYHDQPLIEDAGFAVFRLDTNSIRVSLRYASTSDNAIVVELRDVTPNTDIDVRFRFVMYTGTTIPTAYSPFSNICPITGHTGVNVTRTGKNMINPSELVYSAGGNNVWYEIHLPPDTDFVFSTDSIITGLYVAYSDADEMPSISSGLGWHEITYKYNTTSLSFNSGSHKWYRLMTYEINGVIRDRLYQLELGSTATAYEPYQGETYPITFPSEAGTVYGGSLTIAEDGSGVLTVDRICHTYTGGIDSVITAKGIQVATTGEKWLVIRSTLYLHEQSDNSIAGIAKIKPMCDILPIAAFESLGRSDVQNVFCTQGNWKPASAIKIDGLTTLEGYDAWCADHKPQISWLLETPITYTLTASEITTLLGENNLWHDANGEITVGYKANTKLYIDGKIAELVAQIVNS